MVETLWRPFTLEHFVQGQGLAGHLDGMTLKPTVEKAKDEKALGTWNQNDSKAVT